MMMTSEDSAGGTQNMWLELARRGSLLCLPCLPRVAQVSVAGPLAQPCPKFLVLSLCK
jgi:hypothetical protein